MATTTTSQLKCCMNNGSGCTDKSSGCEDILKAYCTGNINDTFCQTTFKNDYSSDYDYVMATVCLSQNDAGQYPWITNPNCIAYMNNNALATNVLQKFCADKSGNSTYNNICGCYYPQSVYDTFYKKLSSEYNIPPGYESNECSFPTCVQAQIQPPHSNCPSENILNCINISNINNSGNFSGATIGQSNACGITASGTSSSNVPLSGCSLDSDCQTTKLAQYLKLKICSNGVCSYNKTSIIAIAVSIIIIMSIFIALIYYT